MAVSVPFIYMTLTRLSSIEAEDYGSAAGSRTSTNSLSNLTKLPTSNEQMGHMPHEQPKKRT